MHGTRKAARDHKPAPGKQSQFIPLEMPPAQICPEISRPLKRCMHSNQICVVMLFR